VITIASTTGAWILVVIAFSIAVAKTISFIRRQDNEYKKMKEEEQRVGELLQHTQGEKEEPILLKKQVSQKIFDPLPDPQRHRRNQKSSKHMVQPAYPKLNYSPITPKELVDLEKIENFLPSAVPTYDYILDHCAKKKSFPEPKPPVPKIPLKPTKPDPPTLPKEPVYPKDELEKLRIMWFHWLLPFIASTKREDIKRIINRYNLDLSNYHRDKNKIEEKYKRSLEFYEKNYLLWKSDKEKKEKEYQYLLSEWQKMESKWEAEYFEEKKQCEENFLRASQGDTSCIIDSTKLMLWNSNFPYCVSRDAEIFFNKESKLLLINFSMPYMPNVRITKIRHGKVNKKKLALLVEKNLCIP
jgi:hypothetical protein